jgi:hypothetical protein
VQFVEVDKWIIAHDVCKDVPDENRLVLIFLLYLTRFKVWLSHHAYGNVGNVCLVTVGLSPTGIEESRIDLAFVVAKFVGYLLPFLAPILVRP